jgi:hypothetical protein
MIRPRVLSSLQRSGPIALRRPFAEAGCGRYGIKARIARRAERLTPESVNCKPFMGGDSHRIRS